jgi:protocatechuate 3,4-dioxygenase beta subunit
MNIARKCSSFLLLFAFSVAATAQIPIAGKITDSQGQPLAKARVLLLPAAGRYEAGRLLLRGDRPEAVAEAQSNSEGLFDLLAPEEGMWDVRAEKKGFAPQLYRLRPLLEAVNLPAVSLPRAMDLHVRLRNAAGGPLVARVWAAEWSVEKNVLFAMSGQESWRLAPHLALTAEDGTLLLPLAGKKPWTLEVVAQEHLPVKTEVKVGQRRFDKKLQQGVTLALDAIDSERSDALAEVLVVRTGWTLPSTETDAKGHAVLQVAAGEVVEMRFLGGEGHSGTRKLEAPDPKRRQVATVEMVPPLVLGGQVVDRATREPIAGALVWTSALDAWSTTDGAGHYRLSLPPTMRWILLAASRDHAGVRHPVNGKEQRGPTIALPSATALSGVVVDGEDRPVVGVEMEAKKGASGRLMMSFSVLGSTWYGRTGAQGRFHLRGLPLGNTYTVALRKPGYATTEMKLEELTAARRDLRWVLPQGIRATGRVVDERDRPIAGATVQLVPRVEQNKGQRIRSLLRGQGEELEGAMLTNADGRFTTDSLTSGSYDLEARALGFAPGSAPGIEIPKGATEIDLGVIALGPTALIAGRVVDPAGNAIAEAVIRAMAEAPGMPAQVIGFMIELEAPKTQSRQDGSFEIEDQRPGDRVYLHVAKEGFVGSTVPGVKAPTEQPVEVVLRVGSRVLGQVVDSTGAPIAQAMIWLHSESKGGSHRPGVGQMSRTDDKGRFEVKGVAPGLATATVHARGYRQQQLSGLEVPENGILQGVDFTLESGATVRGQVTGGDGRPVIGALIMIGTGSMAGNKEGYAQTDGEGRFEITGISRGPKVVAATAEGGLRTTVHLEVEKEEHTVELVFENGVEVSGYVTDSTGLPVAGAQVSLSLDERSIAFSLGELADQSDAQGNFLISGVPAGTYRTRATKEGFAAHRSREGFEVAVDAVGGVEIILGKGATLSGQISGLEYDAMVRVGITLFGGGGASVRPDFEGRYRISDVPVGTWTVRAELATEGRQVEGKITVEEGVSEITLDLEFGGGYLLTGTVLQGGEPLSGASVAISGRSVSWSSRTTTAHDGTFSMGGLEEGTYSLNVRMFFSGLHYSREFEIDGDEDLLIDIATGRLAGYVRDASGAEVLEGAEISLESLDGGGSRTFGGRTQSDVEGYFNIGQVTEGRWKITVNKAGFAPGAQEVEVSPGTDRRDLEFALEPTERLRFAVVSTQGLSPRAISLALLAPDGSRVSGGSFETSQGGVVEVTTAPKGSWELLIQAGRSGVLSVQATVPGDLGRLVLPAGGQLQITVADLREEGVARARLTGPDGRPYRRLGWRGDLKSEFYLRRGSVSLENLAQGSWKVVVTAEDGRSWNATAVVRAGATAVLELP